MRLCYFFALREQEVVCRKDKMCFGNGGIFRVKREISVEMVKKFMELESKLTERTIFYGNNQKNEVLRAILQ